MSRVAWDRAGLGAPPLEREVEIAGRASGMAVVSLEVPADASPSPA